MEEIVERDLQVVCGWCGQLTNQAIACQSCGSPIEGVVRCRYCRNLTARTVCSPCQDALVRLWRVAQESSDARFLFADVL